jgi:hypothetical protein
MRFALLGLTVVYSAALAFSAIVASKEVVVDGRAMTTDDTVLKTDWPAGAIKNIVQMNIFAMEPEKVLLLSFSDYKELEGRGIDRFLEEPSQADPTKASVN